MTTLKGQPVRALYGVAIAVMSLSIWSARLWAVWPNPCCGNSGDCPGVCICWTPQELGACSGDKTGYCNPPGANPASTGAENCNPQGGG